MQLLLDYTILPLTLCPQSYMDNTDAIETFPCTSFWAFFFVYDSSTLKLVLHAQCRDGRSTAETTKQRCHVISTGGEGNDRNVGGGIPFECTNERVDTAGCSSR